MRTQPFLPFFLCLVAAGCSDSSASIGGVETGLAWRGPAYGPIVANAGPDQRLLEGLEVTLDGRASLLGDDRLPVAVRWNQVGGAPVVLSDASSLVTSFVAPPAGGDPLDFELVLQDGYRTSTDPVRIHVESDPRLMRRPAFFFAGPDRQVQAEKKVTIPVELHRLECPFDPKRPTSTCQSGDSPDQAPLLDYPYCLRQVDGPEVLDLGDWGVCDPAAPPIGPPSFTPHQEGVYTLVVDAKPALDLWDGDGLPRPAPDVIRVRVQSFPFDPKPCTPVISADSIPVTAGDGILLPDGHLLRLPTPASKGHDDNVEQFWSERRPVVFGNCPSPAHRLLRPIFDTPVSDVPNPAGLLWPAEPDATVNLSDPPYPWPEVFAVEVASGGVRNVRQLVAFDHRPPPDLVANAGPDPCGQGGCTPGDQVTLDGSGSTQGGDVTYCWKQTLGMTVPDLGKPPPNGCIRGSGAFEGPAQLHFQVPGLPDPKDPQELVMAFELTVRRNTGAVTDGVSLPDTVLVRVPAPGDNAPVAVLQGPDAADEGALSEIHLDGHCSYDPDSVVGPSTDCPVASDNHPYYYDFKLIDERPGPLTPIQIDQPGGRTNPHVTAHAPPVTRETTLVFQLTVTHDGKSSDPNDPRSIIEVDEANSFDEPPVAFAAALPSNILPAETTTSFILTSAGSYDPNHDKLFYSWKEIDPAGACPPSLSSGPDSSSVTVLVGPKCRAQLEGKDELPLTYLLTVNGCMVVNTDGTCAVGKSTPATVQVWLLKEGPWVSHVPKTSGNGVKSQPFNTLAEALNLARTAGFKVVHLDEGRYTTDPDSGMLTIGAREIRGGYSYTCNPFLTECSWKEDPESFRAVLLTGRGIELDDGSSLTTLDVRLAGDGAAALVVRGQQPPPTLSDVGVYVDSSSAARTAGILVDGGVLHMLNGSTVEGRVDRDGSGIDCESGSINLDSVDISGGGGFNNHTGVFLTTTCSAQIKNSAIKGGPFSGINPSDTSIGLDSLSQGTVDVKQGLAAGGIKGACSLLGGFGKDLVAGARVVNASFNGCDIQGGQGYLGKRIGLYARNDKGAGCLARAGSATCATVEGGELLGGQGTPGGQSGIAEGLLAEVPISVQDASIIGDPGVALVAPPSFAIGAELRAGGTLADLSLIAGSLRDVSNQAEGILNSGPLSLRDVDRVVGSTGGGASATGLSTSDTVTVEGNARFVGVGTVTQAGISSSVSSTGVRVQIGGSLTQLQSASGGFGIVADSGPGSSQAIGIQSFGPVDLTNALILAGPAPQVEGIASHASVNLQNSLVRTRPLSKADSATLTSAVVLQYGGLGPVFLRNVILDTGVRFLTPKPPPSQATHILVDPLAIGPPQIMNAVLFSSISNCDPSLGFTYLVVPGKASLACTPTAIDGNYNVILDDPTYVNQVSDLHLQPGSRGVDEGTSDHAPGFDHDGASRPQGTTCVNRPWCYDIGPYEQ